MASFCSSSIYKMSDFVIDMYNCEPCKQNTLDKEATDFCCECDKYLCATCTTAHQGSKPSKGHRIMSVGELTSIIYPSVVASKITCCENHTSKENEWYCKVHGVMFCDGCKSTRHRGCKLTRASEMAKASSYKQQLSDLEDALRLMGTRLDILKKASEQSGTHIKDAAKSCEADVKKLKKKICDWAKTLEKTMLADIKKASTDALYAVSEQQRVFISLTERAKKEAKVVNDAKSVADRPRRFMAHQLSKTVTDMNQRVDAMEGEEYTFSLQLVDLVHNIEQLATLKVISRVTAKTHDSVYDTVTSIPDSWACVVKSFRDMSVVTSAAVKIPDVMVTGSAFLPDGRLVLVQWDTQKVILLDRDMVVTSALGLPPHPWDVAVTGDTEVAVTVSEQKKLQFVTVGTAGLQLGRSITTDSYCWGVDVHNDLNYVSVHDNPGDGCVIIMSMTGVVSHRIAVDAGGHGILQRPYYVAASDRGIYVSDRGTGVISYYTLAGVEVYRAEGGTMKGPRGILPDDEGNILVCCASSHEVHLLKPDGTWHTSITSLRDCVRNPTSVSYRGSDDTLVVTSSRDPNVTKFKVKFE